MKILLINNRTFFLKELSNYLKGHELKIKDYTKVTLKDTENKDAIILSGGSEDIKKLSKEKEIIKKANIPIFGICLGFQLICCAFGGHMGKLPKIEKGILKIKVLNKNLIFKGTNKTIKVFEDHRYDINKVKNNLIILAKSKDGIEAVKHKRKPIYGVQFHPEITKNNKGYILLRNFLEEIK